MQVWPLALLLAVVWAVIGIWTSGVPAAVLFRAQRNESGSLLWIVHSTSTPPALGRVTDFLFVASGKWGTTAWMCPD